jgi:hypothetical protein
MVNPNASPQAYITISSQISGISYVAKLYLDKLDFEAVKKAHLIGFMVGLSPADNKPRLKLEKAVATGVRLFIAAPFPFKVEGEPHLAIRGLSVSVTDMNERCQLEPEFGYKWVSLELTLP